MALDDLVDRARSISKGLTTLNELERCCYNLLHETFGVAPTDAEVKELVRAVRRVDHRELDRILESQEGDGREPLQRQTGGGREVIRKSEHRAG